MPPEFAASEAPLDFQVHRDRFRDTRFVEGDTNGALAKDEVRLRIDRFALTSNNISYAAAGDMLKYWDFFPAPDRWGRIPAMGFGNVVESAHDSVEVGTRYFGFVPMSRFHTLEVKPNAGGFVDARAHRAEHAPIYRNFLSTMTDALYEEALEDEILLLRALFMTSFLIDDLYADEDFFGAGTSMITSASSKTSIALAHLLSKRGHGSVVGLTSDRNRAFVQSLGCYDSVVSYDELAALRAKTGAVLVDMAGNADVVRQVHEGLGENLKSSLTVGATHWNSKPSSGALPGPQPEFFFAPSRIVKRTQDWGATGFEERLGDSWRAFADFSQSWLKVLHHRGPGAVETAFQEVASGALNPSEGHILSLWD